jgi:putative transcriptional regulator
MRRLAAGGWLPVLALLLLLAAPAQARERVAPGRGMLLVAAEGMADPRFAETVILLVRYGPEGVAGLILNRPTSLGLTEALPEMPALGKGGAVISWGGPVEPRTLLALLECGKPPAVSEPVAGAVHLTGPPQVAERMAQGTKERFRVFMGYAGWSQAQLAGEIARGDWHVLPFDGSAVFTDRPLELWQRLLPPQEIWL